MDWLDPEDAAEATTLGLLMLAVAFASVCALSSAVIIIYRLVRRYVR